MLESLLLLSAMFLAVFISIAAPCQAIAQDFYAGKTISLSTHSTAGAGYDAYLRLLSRHMGKYIAGRPGFVVINQPGAGGLLAVNYAARVAPQDGTFLTIVSQGLLVLEATGGRGLQTSLGSFKWVGNFSQSNNVTVTWGASKVKYLQDAIVRDVTVGATGAGSATVVGPTLYNALLGTRFKIIQGYNGSGQINLAMQRGELDGHANSTWTSIKTTLNNEFRAGHLNVLIQMGCARSRNCRMFRCCPISSSAIPEKKRSRTSCRSPSRWRGRLRRRPAFRRVASRCCAAPSMLR
jgi:tripartite-type tricarboxylate transporter receptor subunit TctC